MLTFPLTVTVALLAPLPVLYLTGLYQVTLEQPVVDAAVRVALVMAGFGYYWTRLGIDPTPGAGTHLGSFALSMAENLVDGLLGVVAWLGPLVVGAHYVGLHRTGGPSVRDDQTAGAVALWFGGDVIGLAYLVVLFGAWSRSDARAARRIDAELDARVRTVPDASHAVPPAMQDGLWWETDDRFADRFGRPPEQQAPGT